MGSATPPPQTPGSPGVCGIRVAQPIHHKLSEHGSTHAPQTPCNPGVCGGGVALPIHHKPEKIWRITSRCGEISTKNEELVGSLSMNF